MASVVVGTDADPGPEYESLRRAQAEAGTKFPYTGYDFVLRDGKWVIVPWREPGLHGDAQR